MFPSHWHVSPASSQIFLLGPDDGPELTPRQDEPAGIRGGRLAWTSPQAAQVSPGLLSNNSLQRNIPEHQNHPRLVWKVERERERESDRVSVSVWIFLLQASIIIIIILTTTSSHLVASPWCPPEIWPELPWSAWSPARTGRWGGRRGRGPARGNITRGRDTRVTRPTFPLATMQDRTFIRLDIITPKVRERTKSGNFSEVDGGPWLSLLARLLSKPNIRQQSQPWTTTGRGREQRPASSDGGQARQAEQLQELRQPQWHHQCQQWGGGQLQAQDYPTQKVRGRSGPCLLNTPNIWSHWSLPVTGRPISSLVCWATASQSAQPSRYIASWFTSN